MREFDEQCLYRRCMCFTVRQLVRRRVSDQAQVAKPSMFGGLVMVSSSSINRLRHECDYVAIYIDAIIISTELCNYSTKLANDSQDAGENRSIVIYIHNGRSLLLADVRFSIEWPRINKQFLFHQLLGLHQPWVLLPRLLCLFLFCGRSWNCQIYQSPKLLWWIACLGFPLTEFDRYPRALASLGNSHKARQH